MRFKVKNDFIYKGRMKKKGTVVNVSANLINKLREANVIEEPIKDFGTTEEAITGPKETTKKE